MSTLSGSEDEYSSQATTTNCGSDQADPTVSHNARPRDGGWLLEAEADTSHDRESYGESVVSGDLSPPG